MVLFHSKGLCWSESSGLLCERLWLEHPSPRTITAMGAATPSDVALTILETDEIDTPLATYVYSESTIAERRDAEQSENKRRVRKGRLDIVVSWAIEFVELPT